MAILIALLFTVMILFANDPCPAQPPTELRMYLMPDTRATTTRVNQLFPSEYRQTLSLDGPWEFQLDEQDQGFADNWHRGQTTFPNTTTLPGAIDAIDLGHRYGSGKFQTNLQGRVWYARDLTIPADWAGRNIRLNIGGATPNFIAWIDGQLVGARYCDLAGFSYDLTPFLTPGQTHRLVISINTRDARTSRTDQAFMPWSGIWRSIEVQATNPTHITDVFVRPDIDASTANFQIELTNAADQPRDLHLSARVTPWTDANAATTGNATAQLHLEPRQTKTLTIPVGVAGMKLWTTEDPFLYRFDVTLTENAAPLDSWSGRFGMRKWHVDAGRLMLNNHPAFIRGGMFQFDFPQTICPPHTRDAWRQRVREAKDFGFNYLRLPGASAPPELCDVADEQGMLLSATVSDLGIQPPRTALDKDAAQAINVLLLRRWWEEQVRELRNHPSLFIYVLANESTLINFPYLPELYHHVKHLDPTRIIANCDGPHPVDNPQIDLYDETDIWIPTSWPSPQQMSRKPFMVHEYVNVASLPDISTLARDTGPLFSPWLQGFANTVESFGLTEDYPRLLASSHHMQRGWVQLLFEALRMKPEADGYMACAQRDAGDVTYAGFLGRYGAPKEITPDDMRRWQGDTLLLCNLVSPLNRTYYGGEPIAASFTLSHYADQVIQNATLHWRLRDGDQLLAQGQLADINVAPYQLNSLGDIQFTCPAVSNATSATFEATLQCDALSVSNTWDLWLFPTDQWLTTTNLPVASTLELPQQLRDRYPFITPSPANAVPSSPSSLLITDTLKPHLDFLAAGGRVLLLKPTEFPALPGAFIPGWWIPRHGNQGTILENHPALARFPHQGFAGMQFGALMGGDVDMHKLVELDPAPDRLAKGYANRGQSTAVLYKQLPFTVDPLAHGITWLGPWNADPRPITYLFQLNVGQGKLLVVGYDVTGPLPEQNWMFDSLLRYAMGAQFSPRISVSADELQFFLSSR
jgi:hypothetical protein